MNPLAPTGTGPDGLGLASAGTIVSALVAWRWPAFGPVVATLAVLALVSLLLRWSDAPHPRGPPSAGVVLAGSALGGAAAYLLVPAPASLGLLGAAVLAAALGGRPRPTLGTVPR